MRISATVFMTDEIIPPARLARALEERGFDGLYLPEHSHIPVDGRSTYPGGDSEPPELARMLNPFVALAQAAAVTERLGLGTNVTLVAQHDPVDLAKQIATLDHLSGGRFTLGVGYGWNREEAEDHGVEWATRRSLVRERLALMRALWADEPTAYEGEFGSVRASEVHPKPRRKPRATTEGPLYGPRVLIGAPAGPRLYARVAAYADGWLPVGGSGLSTALPALREAWREAGRDPADGPYVALSAVEPTAGKLAHYRELGVDEVILQLPPAGEREVTDVLDEYARHLPGATGRE